MPRLLVSRTLALVAVCIAVLLCIISITTVSGDASQYSDCDSCIENGYGWSWSKQLCGGYLNTNCDPDSAEALDEEEDEDFASQHRVDDTPFEIPPPAPIPSEPVEWANTESTTQLWRLANTGDIQTLAAWAYRQPEIVHIRSEDGRGALFWASEYGKYEMIDFLLERGADPDATDASGNRPADLLTGKRPAKVPQTLNVEQAKEQAKNMRSQ